MQSLHALQRTRVPRLAGAHPRSGGAVIIIVLTLLSTMVFLGFFFFGFTDQAQLAARSYAEADDSRGLLNPEEPFNLAFEQLIVGTRSQFEESALWGGRYSMLSTIVGPIDGNLRPMMDSLYAGGGMRLVEADEDGNGVADCYAMDYDGDGIADDLDSNGVPDHIAYRFNESGTRVYTPNAANGFRLNLSRVAQNNARNDAFNSLSYGVNNAYAVTGALNNAAGYTYPDLANLFLASETTVSLPDADTMNNVPVKVVIPSFFRPQLLMAERQEFTGGAFNSNTLFTNNAYRSMSLRPHSGHRNLSTLPRFVLGPTVAQSGDTSRLIRPFPFNVDRDRNGRSNEFGIFTDPTDSERSGAADPAPRSNYYEYDVDNDGDGIYESIWMDLGLPMIDLADGRQVVPLVAFKVLDANGLFNVNVHGNLAGLYFPDVNTPLNTTYDPPFLDFNGNGVRDANEPYVPLHRSNMGLGPGEINLGYGLFDNLDFLSLADRVRLAAEYAEMGITYPTGGNPNPELRRYVASAAEAMFLLTGRLPANGGQVLAGRHGETNILLEFLAGNVSTLPRAGRTNTIATPTLAQLRVSDDDHDLLTTGGQSFNPANTLVDYSTGTAVQATNVATPASVHPLPLNGAGMSYLSAAAGGPGATRLLHNPIADNPSRWPDYRSGHWNDHNYLFNAPAAGPRPYSQAGIAAGSLQNEATAVTDLSTYDEDDEHVAIESQANPADAPFAPSENAALQLSRTDFALSGEFSRLRDLAPLNFRDSPTPTGAINGHNGAEANRKMFTTDSWDRNEFALYPRARPWEFNVWDGESIARFPPEFGGAMRVPAYQTTSPEDPLRPVVRQLLATSIGNLDSPPNFKDGRSRPQFPLNINKLLTGIDARGNPIYRDLVPHPTFGPTDNITLPAAAPDFSTIGTDPANAEWWARHDRQTLARDIFTLLWVVSGGKDGTDYTDPTQLFADLPPEMAAGREDDHYEVLSGNAQTQIEARDRIREMAQFAVNVVDALDRDNVITEFRYDENLADGWDISTDFQTVYGVEAAQLTLSEVLAIRTPPVTSDDPRTEANDADGHQRYHLFVELKNASPFHVSIQNAEWRIRRIPSGAVATAQSRFAVLRDGVYTSPNTGTVGAVEPGDTYLIASQDGTNRFAANQYRTSDFRVDYDTTGTFDAIVPNLPDPSPPTSANTYADYPPPLCDLDLFANGTLSPAASHVGRYLPNGDTTANAQFNELTSLLNYTDVGLENGDSTNEIIDNVTIVLERRLLNSGATVTDGVGLDGNPWIEVDRMPDVPVQVFNIVDTMQTTEQLLQNVRSYERREPFYPRTEMYQDPNPMAMPPNIRQHTLPLLEVGSSLKQNSGIAAGANFNYWQPHFDRDFASVIDLLSIPLYGYAPAATDPLGLYNERLDRTSAGINDTTGEARMFRAGGPTKNLINVNGRMSGHRTAAVRFLHPEALPGANLLALSTQSTGYNGFAPTQIEVQKHYRNRWYRLLHFLTVPDRSDELAKQRVAFNGRTPGKLNLNMIRHEQVMAGLLDDPVHMDPLSYPEDGSGNPWRLTQDPLEPATDPRNWYLEMRGFRDQADPFLGVDPVTTGISIPGNVNAVPFRPLGHIDGSGDLSISQTILRSRRDGEDTDMDTIVDTQPHGLFEARTFADVGTDAVDYHSRNRLLAKIHNRTTTRSNVFFVWATIGYFEAHQPPFAGTQGYVQIGAQAEDIPMRRTFAVVDMSRLEQAYDDPDPTDGQPGTFDFRRFIIYRKLIK